MHILINVNLFAGHSVLGQVHSEGLNVLLGNTERVLIVCVHFVLCNGLRFFSLTLSLSATHYTLL